MAHVSFQTVSHIGGSAVFFVFGNFTPPKTNILPEKMVVEVEDSF